MGNKNYITTMYSVEIELSKSPTAICLGIPTKRMVEYKIDF